MNLNNNNNRPRTCKMRAHPLDAVCCIFHPGAVATGVGKVYLKLDVIKIGITITTTNLTAQMALQDNRNMTANITETAKYLGIKECDIERVDISITPVQNGTTFYVTVKNTIEIKTNCLDKATEIIDAISNRTNIAISYVNFEIDYNTLQRVKEKLIVAAIDDAIDKALPALDKLNYFIEAIQTVTLTETPDFPNFICDHFGTLPKNVTQVREYMIKATVIFNIKKCEDD